MQTYTHVGFGFLANLLSEEQTRALLDSDHCGLPCNEIGVTLVSNFEDWEGKEWGALVVKDLGEIGEKGKMASISEVAKRTESGLTNEEMEKVKTLFGQFGMLELLNKIEPILYVENY